MTANSPSVDIPAFYARKLCALLQDPTDAEASNTLLGELSQTITELTQALEWWESKGPGISNIGSASDRVNLDMRGENLPAHVEVRHPISGQSQTLRQRNSASRTEELKAAILGARDAIAVENDAATTLKRLYWWCWRFYPELSDKPYTTNEEQANQQRTTLLYPAHRILPDCPVHSYNSTVAALAGAMFPADWQEDDDNKDDTASKPHLLLFTFSPVQEFIKASRKFADFWSGSYMLHYLSARLCWRIAQDYGPDAIITPSLWGQEIIDALLAENYSGFATEFGDRNPVDQFNAFTSRSLSTAGFPNTITALVPGKKAAITLGKALQNELKTIWCDIAQKVREDIKHRVITFLSSNRSTEAWQLPETLFPPSLPKSERQNYQRELHHLMQHGCWEWNRLWEVQIEHTWQPYFVAVPLGNPDMDLAWDLHNIDLERELKRPDSPINTWLKAQNNIAQPREDTPTKAECQAYQQIVQATCQQHPQLNVGTWWGSLQARLGQSVQAIKNTRRWQIPVAPGERSSLSGQFSALHPRFNYTKFKHGRGMTSGSMRLFWKLMSLAYPGLFDGSEKLNALEVTKRMAWIYGGVADSLGVQTNKVVNRIRLHRQQADTKLQWEQAERLLYERFSRFPNLSSIASARFIHDHHHKTRAYMRQFEEILEPHLSVRQMQLFRRSTQRRPSQVPATDRRVNPHRRRKQYLNGVMFSSKWLAEDLGLSREETVNLRGLVSQTHQKVGFSDGSPSDWWVLLLADGDGMGQYVNGYKLHTYKEYLIEDLVERSGIDPQPWKDFLDKTKKRMGPATHVGLNRALLDFSNRLVPHLTEHRFCGKVIYSGGDDVLVALPLADLPGFLRSLRAAWSGDADPGGEDPEDHFHHVGDYWQPPHPLPEKMAHLPDRPLFTMGTGATMSMGIIVAHKSVPLPTVLENLWEAEKDRAKKLFGGHPTDLKPKIPAKDGLCFRIIYGSGNTLEALMKGHLLDLWWDMVKDYQQYDLSPVFNRLAEELPKHVEVTSGDRLCCQAAKAILLRREDQLSPAVQTNILKWLSEWETWAWTAQQTAARQQVESLGTDPQDLAALLRFTAFWVSRRRQELDWVGELQKSTPLNSTPATSATQEELHAGL